MQAIKKPIQLQFRRVTADEEVIQTIEGPITARKGDAVLTGTKSECWPVSADKFAQTYQFDEAAQTCQKKIKIVEVEQINEPFEVLVGWASEPLKGKAGDYKIDYGNGDFGVVDAEIFKDTYAIVETTNFQDFGNGRFSFSVSLTQPS